MVAGKELPPDPLDPQGRPRWDWMCNGHNSNGSGTLCRAKHRIAQTKCKRHGGNTPQALRKAQERIDRAAFDMVGILIDIAADDLTVENRDRINAAKELLNRTAQVRQPNTEVKVTGEVGPSPILVKLIEDARAKVEAMGDEPFKGKVFSLDNVIDAEVVDE